MSKVKTSFFAKIVVPNIQDGKDNAIPAKNGIPSSRKLFKKKKNQLGNPQLPIRREFQNP